MPLRLNVGVTKKLGLPEYSSVGAGCHLELELESRLLEADLDAFRRQVRDAYVACNQAVNDDLARHQASPVAAPSGGHAAPAGGHPRGDAKGQPASRTDGARGRAPKPTTPSQVRATS